MCVPEGKGNDNDDASGESEQTRTSFVTCPVRMAGIEQRWRPGLEGSVPRRGKNGWRTVRANATMKRCTSRWRPGLVAFMLAWKAIEGSSGSVWFADLTGMSPWVPSDKKYP